MTRREAWKLLRQIQREPHIQNARLRFYQDDSYSVEAVDLATGIPFVVHSREAWEERRQAAEFYRTEGEPS
jgi:hypothetical protein